MRSRRPIVLFVLALGLALSRPAAAEDFQACLAGLRTAALAQGVSAATFDGAAAGLTPNDVLHYQHEQPEFTIPVWDYMAALVDQERVDDGLAMQDKYAEALHRIEARFGVDRATLVAFWGVESNYGKSFGQRPVVQSLATLACYGDKPAYFRSELMAALAILQRGDVKPDQFVGSWAGAFGHTQFMPSTFLRNAVDMEGDGHPDIVGSVADALGSTANYLRKSGWVPGLPWGYEARLPQGYKGPSGRKASHPAAFWTAHGIRRIDGRPVGSGRLSLLLPAGPAGPAFLVTRNFDAIYAYNAAETYALAVGTLSDRLRGGSPLATPWPTDDPGLSRAERRELQGLLLAKGYDIGGADGAIGAKTREAIADFEQRQGMARNGRASLKVLQALRSGQ
ncbi:MAG TPA: lytic murein transglycosylase [Lichenihabitans sp.]|jgi:lytic murein transglycosylase|nr:lytic murein transglycosylase [Lichenihabitans sp.]